VTDFADALEYALERTKARHGARVGRDPATGRVTLTTMQRVKPLEPKRARLVDAAACLLNVPAETARAEVDLWRSGVYTLAYMLAQHTDAATSPRDAWELLVARGLVPEGWADDPLRRFQAPGGAPPAAGTVVRVDPQNAGRVIVELTGPIPILRRPPIPTPDARHVVFEAEETLRAGDQVVLTAAERVRSVASARAAAQPPTIAACLAIASDVPGILRAEGFARAAAERFLGWGALRRRPDTAAWRFGVRPPFLRRTFLQGVVDAMEARDVTSEERAEVRRLQGDQTDDDLAARMLRRDQARAWLYDRLERRAGWAAPNPFTPLLDLWGTGYALDDVTDDAIVLACPELGT
jgi:hypothetical protein